MELEDFLQKLLGVRRKGNQYIADCPVCGKAGHLYIKDDGVLLAFCQHCKARFPAILRAVGGMNRDGESPVPIPKPKKNRTLVEFITYEYRNPDGTVAYCKDRKKFDDGHKEFYFHYTDASGVTVNRKPDGCNNLYRLDDLAKANAAETLYIVEGEKCADAMARQGFLATSTNTGAQKDLKLSDMDRKAIDKFPNKVMIPDNDKPGDEYGKAWEALGAVLLELPTIWEGCPPKGDVADYFEWGGNPDAIRNYKPLPKPAEVFTREWADGLDSYSIISDEVLDAIIKSKDRVRAESLATIKAKELKCATEFKRCLKKRAQVLAQRNASSENMTRFTDAPLTLNCGEYMADDNGVRRLTYTTQGDPKTAFASAQPVLPVEVLQNVEERTQKIRLAFKTGGAWRSVLTARSTISNANRIIELADYGLAVSSDTNKELVKYLATCLNLNPGALPPTESTSHLGWNDGDFVPYSGELKLDTEQDFKRTVDAIREEGTLDEWIQTVRPLMANLYLRLTVAASLASPLIEKVGALPFVLHLWGGTGAGKTVGMMVAASVWGNPAPGHLVRTLNTTDNAIMAMAWVLHSFPFFGDELQTIKTQGVTYDQLIMRVTEGIDRSRMKSGDAMQSLKTWANAFIFTGEEPCTMSRSGGGVKNRVIEIECMTPVVADGNTVVAAVRQQYGTLGPAYIKALQDINVRQVYNGFFKELLKLDTTEKQAMAMALMLTADAILQWRFMPDLTPLSIDDVKPLVKSKKEIDVAERAYSVVMDWIGEHANAFANSADETHAGDIYGKTGAGFVAVIKSVLEREMESMGFSFTAVKRKWAEQGRIEKNNQGRYFFSDSIGGLRATTVRFIKKMENG